MKTRTALVLAAIAALVAGAPLAISQIPQFPQTLQPNTVVGRLGNGAGPAQQIPFGILAAQIHSTTNPIVNVIDAGAIGDGTTDDTVAIQGAINALPASGGTIQFPAKNYKITSTLNIGNGSGSAGSTRQGVILQGVGNPNTQPVFPGFTATGGPKLTWAGSGSGGVISINGPLQGWGVQNLYIDCASIPNAVGINYTSAANGDSRDITTVNCFRGIVGISVATFGSFTNTDSIHNKFYGTSIQVPAAAGAMGILLTGVATSNVDYNTFTNTDIALPTSVVAVQGMFLQVSDTNHFYNLHVYGGNASAVCVGFDYQGASNNFPSANRLMGVDVGNCGGGTMFANGGTPGASAAANLIFLDLANASVCPILANLSCVSAKNWIPNFGGNTTAKDILAAWTAFTPTPVCGTATFTTNSARFMTMGKTSFVEISWTITALGTCTQTITFTLPNTPNSPGSVVGNNGNTGHAVSCRIGPGSPTATCNDAVGGNFVNGDSFNASAIYEIP